MADFLQLGATLLGGLLGSQANKDQTQTVSKDPWGPAQPYLLDNLARNKQLQDYYQKTPFNPQQIQNYSNLQGDIGNFRDNVMPGLMDFANKGMTSSYQRQTGGAVGSGGGYGGAVVPGGMRQSGTGPFSVAQGAGARSTGVNGLLDLNGAQNPFSAQNQPPSTQTAAMNPGVGLLGNNPADRGGDGQQDGTPYGGIGIGPETDRINAMAEDIGKKFGLASPLAGLAAGLISRGMSISDALAAVNAQPDPMKALIDLQKWSPGDSGYGGDNSNRSDPGGYGSMADTKND